MIRVLVVDDSAFARKVVRELLQRHSDIEVVDIARDGLEALEKIAELKPDVVTLDLVMPNLDGVGVLRALPAEGAPRVVVVSMSDADSELGVEALSVGAFDLVHKPTALATDRLYDLGDELVRKVRVAASARAPRLGPIPPSPSSSPGRITPPKGVVAANAGTELVVIGASTGGPPALTRLLAALPGDFPVPIALVLHIPAEYTGPFAARLDAGSALEVVEAFDGAPLRPGRVVVARGGIHLKLVRADGGLVCSLDVQPIGTPHRPAVDVLFQSAAAAVGKSVRRRGAHRHGRRRPGRRARDTQRRAGGCSRRTESSCVVYGMPRTVVEAGLSNESAPIGEMAALLGRFV